MNLSGIPDKSFLGRILRLPLRLIPKRLAVPILQGRLKGYKWIVGASIHGCWLGSYEYEKQKAFARAVRPGGVVFDLGAHAGFYTLLACALVGPKGKVFAFEPAPRNLFYLKEHLKLNNATNATIIEAAVSDTSGTAYFERSDCSLMGHIAEHGQLQVNKVALDELVLQDRLPLPDLLKIDIEGAEILALSGAKNTIAKSRPIIFLATHGDAVHKACCRFLESFGYSLQPLDTTEIDRTTEIIASPRLQDGHRVP